MGRDPKNTSSTMGISSLQEFAYPALEGYNTATIRTILMKHPTRAPGDKYLDPKDDFQEKIEPIPPEEIRRKLR